MLLYALYQVLTRMVGRVDAAETSLLWQLVVGAVVAAASSCRSSGGRPSPEHWPLFVVVAALGGVGHYCMIRALQLAPAVGASSPSPTRCCSGRWSSAIVGFGDLPDRWTLLGAAVIVAAGIYTAVREHRLRRPRRDRLYA